MKDTWNLYIQSYKTLVREIKENLIEIGRLNTVKMSILSKLICRFRANTI